LTPAENSPVTICCDKDSRHEGFDVVAAIARNCVGGKGYTVFVKRANDLIQLCAPSLRHRWDEFGGGQDSHTRITRAAKFSGLRNQGCTCYMNSAQLWHLMSASLWPNIWLLSGTTTTICGDAILVGRNDIPKDGWSIEKGFTECHYWPL
jgi:hypothetical protein